MTIVRSRRIPRQRVLFVTAAFDAVGGIPRYSRAVVAALSVSADVSVLDLRLTGSLAGQLRALARATAKLAICRPNLLVLGHVGLGPIGIIWRCLGGRYVVIAYGIEVWGPHSRRVSQSLRRATSVWPISSWTRREVLRTAPGANVGPVLGGSISDDQFQDHDPSTDTFVVLFVASPADLPYKGLSTLIEAGGQLVSERSIEIRVAGSESERGALRECVNRCDTAGIVRLLGRLDDAALLAEYRAASVVVLVSRFRRGPDPEGEGLGLVPLEAAAAGTPAVVGREGGSVDTVIPDKTGFLVEAGRTEELTNALRCLASDPLQAARMGAEAREFVRHTHSAHEFQRRIQAALAAGLG